MYVGMYVCVGMYLFLAKHVIQELIIKSECIPARRWSDMSALNRWEIYILGNVGETSNYSRELLCHLWKFTDQSSGIFFKCL